MSIGAFPLPGIRMPCWILRFDERGDCISPDTLAKLLEELRSGPYTDLIAFSHGWNNEFGVATERYTAFLRHLEPLLAGKSPREVRPLFIGAIWPSTWLDFAPGPKIAATPAADPSFEEGRKALIGQLTASADKQAAASLTSGKQLSAADATRLAALIAGALGPVQNEEISEGAAALTPADLLSAGSALEHRLNPPPPGDIDNFGTLDDGPAAPIEAAGILAKLDPRNLVRLFSVYQMKDRAGTVGSNGVAAMIRSVLDASKASAPHLHLVGHSFGGKVMLSALCAPAPLSRPVRSLLLLQPAISHLCFARQVRGTNRPGGFVAAREPSRVSPPIVSTFSRKDFPLHETFHLTLRRAADLGEARIAAGAGEPPSRFAALGGYGPRDADQLLIGKMPRHGETYPPAIAAAPIVGLDGSDGVIGGHGDVTTADTAWALRTLIYR